ncbi:MAG: hypothetical protein Q7R45_01455, partial [Sulfuricaulis sp.]|nr:hypothetical protein [Sulfuricaulis sp.]
MSRLLSFVRKMVGASVGADGRSGYAPKPLAGEHGKFMRGDATWQNVPGGGDVLIANNGAEWANKTARDAFAPNVNLRQVQEITDQILAESGHVLFNGISGDRATSQLVGSNVGTNDFTLRAKVRIPTANPSSAAGIATLSSSSTTTAGYAFGVYVGTTGKLTAILYGATVSDLRLKAVTANAVTTWGGKLVTVSVTRSGSTLKWYVDDTEVAMDADTT